MVVFTEAYFKYLNTLDPATRNSILAAQGYPVDITKEEDPNKPILYFTGKNKFLSNYYDQHSNPIDLGDGLTYKSAEAAFQGGKVYFPTNKSRRNPKSPQHRLEKRFCDFDNPAAAKSLGRKIELRPDWEEIKDSHMRRVLEAKFSDPELAQKLIDTGDKFLCEGNSHHDNYWGNCTCPKCRDIEGQNHLGLILMNIREQLKNKDATIEEEEE